jgi:hypothetical protein
MHPRCLSPPIPSLGVLHMGANIDAASGCAASAHLVLADGALPPLREVKASRDVVNAILVCLSLDLDCWGGSLYLDVGHRLGGTPAAAQRVHEHHHHPTQNATVAAKRGVAPNMVEQWALMSTMPELTAMHV